MRISLKTTEASKSLGFSTYKWLMYSSNLWRGKPIAKQPGFGIRISKVVVDGLLITRPCFVFDMGVPLNMTTARCSKMDDETVPMHHAASVTTKLQPGVHF